LSIEIQPEYAIYVHSKAERGVAAILRAKGCLRDVVKARVRDLIRITGRLFHAWPDMVDAARELRNKGIRISADIDDSTSSIFSG
jgi:hypothetical protein